MKDEIDLLIDYPAHIAQKLISNEIDVGLVPVAIIPELKQYSIISDYCIACDGSVASVCLFSEVPLDEITAILLDYQSRTSVALLRILLKEYFHISPTLIQGTPGYEERIVGTNAGLVIGDRAFAQRSKSKYVFDLGSAWKALTGLPFVFAAWVTNKQLSPGFKERFNEANRRGVDNLVEVVDQHKQNGIDLLEYYTTNIKFKPDFDKLEVITLFLKKIKAAG